MKFCFASYISLIKSHAIDSKISNQNLIGELFCFICEICDRNPENYFNSKSLASDLINFKVDVPETIRNVLINYEINKLIFKISPFYDRYIDKGCLTHLCNELRNLYYNDESILKSNKDLLKSKYLKDYEFLTFLLVQTAKISNKIIEEKIEIFNESGLIINYIFDDIIRIGFNSKYNVFNKIVVIPVNTAFDFVTDGFVDENEFPRVSVKTIHGKWLSKINNSKLNTTNLRRRVEKYRNAKADIGTIVDVVYDKTQFYLLAVSDFDENNRAIATKEGIKIAIEKLLKYYDIKGQGFELYVPLIGTGMSRAKLTHKESFNLLKNILLNNKESLVGIINIVIYDKDYKKMEDLIK